MKSSLSALLFLLVLTLAVSTPAEDRGLPAAGTQYFDRARCGVADPYLLPPRVTMTADLDGNGTPEYYIANAGGIERHRPQPGSTPPMLVLDAVVFSSTANHQYVCVDLQAADIDGDGDSDLVYASPDELVVLNNQHGRLTVARREPQSFPVTSEVRIELHGRDITLRVR